MLCDTLRLVPLPQEYVLRVAARECHEVSLILLTESHRDKLFIFFVDFSARDNLFLLDLLLRVDLPY